MKRYGNLLVLTAIGVIAAGCQKSTTLTAASPSPDSGGMTNSTQSPNSNTMDSNPTAANTTADGATATPATATGLSDSDRDFIMKAAQGGLMEVDAGKLAESQAANAKVKAFGERMVTDHSAVDNQLATIAQKDQITLPTSLPPDDQAKLDHLRTLHGRAFDRAYSNMMVKDHEQDVQDFQQASNSLTDAELRSFAQSTLPTLQTHLSMAQQLPAEHGHMQASADSSSNVSNR
jgi:putative membrane protein